MTKLAVLFAPQTKVIQMSENSLWYLENVDVLGIFCPNKMHDNNENHFTKRFKKGDFIYLPDDRSDNIYVINSGRVKIGAYGDKAKEVTKAVLQKGEVFGELALTGQEKRNDFAYVLEDTEICGIASKEINNLFKTQSSLSQFFLKILGSRVLDMEKRLESLVFKDSRTRVIEFLQDLLDKRGERVGYEWVVRKFLTHQDIANMTATSRQTVTTVLNELKSDEIITFDRKRLLVRDRDALDKMQSSESSA